MNNARELAEFITADSDYQLSTDMVQSYIQDFAKQKCKEKELMKDNIIDVTVIVFADGTTHWFKNKPVYKGKPDPNHDYIDACFSEWKNENDQLLKDHPNICNAVCLIRMPESKYNEIKAEDRFMNSMDRGQG